MSSLVIEELPYLIDSSCLFSRFLDWNHPVFLDSAAAFSTRGRYDIFSAQPEHTLENRPTIPFNSNSYINNMNFFEEVRDAIEHFTPTISNDFHLPFTGGAIGYFGYDLGHQLEEIDIRSLPDTNIPIALVGIYSWAVIVDHRQKRSLLVHHPLASRHLMKDVRTKLAEKARVKEPAQSFTLSSPFRSNLSYAQYSMAFTKIQNYIQSGDCYQVNLSQRFSTEFEGNTWHAYQALRKIAAAPFSAYLGNGKSAILSLSPERFIQSKYQRVSTAPIKGTIGRSDNREEDQKLAKTLLNSTKDRAENLMIVDLLRNDLGKNCIPGTIQVDDLFELQSFETVHHLVSTISGQLKPDIHSLNLLASCFPGGSITGAPKIRAMEIIEELES
ncbi:MAG: para-aminobenzoate synthetase component 1, partial [Oceanicoccus sp.]